MTPVLTRRPRTAPERSAAPGVALALVLGAAALFLLAPFLDTAPHVPEVEFENPNVEQINVDVSREQRDGWVGVGPIDGEESEVVQEVFDPGDTWVFRFVVPGGDSTEVELSRDALRDAGWKVTIPELER